MAGPADLEELLGLPPDMGDDPPPKSPTPPRWIQLCNDVDHAALERERGKHKPGPLIADRFEMLLTLGNGGYGCVFQARDAELGRKVALKLCASDRAEAKELLIEEAKTLARLSAPNILTIYDSGKHGEDVFLVVEYMPGGTLHDYALGRSMAPWRELVKIFADTARGLAAAHDAGVIHRDFKPDNVLLDDELRPCVADFGLARMIDTPTLMPDVVGTLPYAAPEVLAGLGHDALSDQWSFCVALWHCLERDLPFVATGEECFKLPSSEEKMLAAIRQWSGPSKFRRPDLPAELLAILKRGLSRAPSKRYPDMHTLARELDTVMVRSLAEGPAVEPTGEPPTVRWQGRGIGLGAVLLVTAVGLLGAVYRLSRSTMPPAPTHHSPQEREFSAAFEALERGDTQACFQAWSDSYQKLLLVRPRRAASASLELATQIEKRHPNQLVTAWIVVEAAKTFENVEDWTAASTARERAATLYDAAGAPEQANRQRECGKVNEDQARCIVAADEP